MTSEANVMDAPARQALVRGQKTLLAVLKKAGAAQIGILQTAVNEVDYLMEALRLAIETLGVTAEGPEKELHDARMRGLERMAALRKQAGPCLETGEVCDLLGVSRETIRKKVERKQLLALPKGGDRIFPAFQFKDGDVVPGFGDVLAALNSDSPFVVLSFLLSENAELDGKSALEALQAGDADSVIAEARRFLNHG
jgi:hypothetical protein